MRDSNFTNDRKIQFRVSVCVSVCVCVCVCVCDPLISFCLSAVENRTESFAVIPEETVDPFFTNYIYSWPHPHRPCPTSHMPGCKCCCLAELVMSAVLESAMFTWSFVILTLEICCWQN